MKLQLSQYFYEQYIKITETTNKKEELQIYYLIIPPF